MTNEAKDDVTDKIERPSRSGRSTSVIKAGFSRSKSKAHGHL